MPNKETKHIQIRSIKLKDAPARHKFFVELSLNQVGVVHSLDEIDFHTQESEDKIKDFINNKRGLWLIAENSASEIVGEIDITIKNLRRVKHNGFLTIGLIPQYRGLGLGSQLMEQALLWSKQQGLKRIELSVFANNTKAINLYRKYGFLLEGLRKNFLYHDDNNSFEDDILMAYHL